MTAGLKGEAREAGAASAARVAHAARKDSIWRSGGAVGVARNWVTFPRRVLYSSLARSSKYLPGRLRNPNSFGIQTFSITPARSEIELLSLVPSGRESSKTYRRTSVGHSNQFSAATADGHVAQIHPIPRDHHGTCEGAVHFSDLGRRSAKLVPRRQFIGARRKAIGQFPKASTPPGQGATWPLSGFGNFFDT